MEERVGDEKLLIISVTVRGINDHIRFYSQMLCTGAINTSNTTRTQTGAAEGATENASTENESTGGWNMQVRNT